MTHLLETYGLWLVAGLIALESAGIPVPGETSLITAAVFAGKTGKIAVWTIVMAAAAGAVIGNVCGFLIGRSLGYRLLLRYGSYIRLTQTRLKIGQYLFRRYGILLLVIARFVPLLRSIVPLLAGANCMPAGGFVIGSMIGGVMWPATITTLAYWFGEELDGLPTLGVIVAIGSVVAALAAISIFVARREHELAALAEQERPGPLRPLPGMSRSQ